MEDLVTKKKIYEYNLLYEKNLNLLIKFLNKIHKLKLKRNYWETLIGTWLSHFLVIYVMFEKNLDLHNINKEQFSFSEKINWTPPKDYKDFIKSCDRPSFYQNIFLKKKFFEKKNNNSMSISFNKDTYKFPKITVTSTIKILFNLISLMFFNIFAFLYKKKYSVMSNYGIELKEKFQFFINSYGKIQVFPNINEIILFLKYIFYKEQSKEKRVFRKYDLREYNLSLNDKIIFKLILSSMPSLYIEEFKYIKHLNNILFPLNPKYIYSEGQHHSDENFKFIISNWISKNSKMLIGQHAARTGLEDNDVLHSHDCKVGDTFLSWGWSGLGEKTIPSISYRLSEKLNKFSKSGLTKQKTKITYILSGLNYFQGAVFEHNINHSNKILNARRQLFDSIKKANINNFIIRKRGNIFNNELRKNENYSNYNFEYSEPSQKIEEIYTNSKIIIFERISTGLFECILFNIPVIFYKAESTSNFNNNVARELIDLLSKAGILFNDPILLTNFLKENTVCEWWEDQKTVKIKNLIISKYARTSDKYIHYWINKLK